MVESVPPLEFSQAKSSPGVAHGAADAVQAHAAVRDRVFPGPAVAGQEAWSCISVRGAVCRTWTQIPWGVLAGASSRRAVFPDRLAHSIRSSPSPVRGPGPWTRWGYLSRPRCWMAPGR